MGELRAVAQTDAGAFKGTVEDAEAVAESPGVAFEFELSVIGAVESGLIKGDCLRHGRFGILGDKPAPTAQFSLIFQDSDGLISMTETSVLIAKYRPCQSSS